MATAIVGAQLGAVSLGFPEGLVLLVPVLVWPFVVIARHNRRAAAAASI